MPTVAQQSRAARRSIRQGDRAEAAALAQDVLRQSPQSLFAVRLLGWAALEDGKRDAFNHFQNCALIDPEDPLSYVGQAVYSERNGVTEAALKHFRRAAELAPDDELIADEVERLGGAVAESALTKGLRSLGREQLAEAIPLLRQAIEERPEDPVAKLALARALWEDGSLDEITALATQVLTTHPLSVVALMIQLAAERRSGRALRARELQSKVDAIDPGFALHPELARALGLQAGR